MVRQRGWRDTLLGVDPTQAVTMGQRGDPRTREFIGPDVKGNINISRRGQRQTQHGVVFKRELKVTNVEGSKIKQGIVHEGFSDLFDGDVSYFPLLEDTVDLRRGEIPIGNTYIPIGFL